MQLHVALLTSPMETSSVQTLLHLGDLYYAHSLSTTPQVKSPPPLLQALAQRGEALFTVSALWEIVKVLWQRISQCSAPLPHKLPPPLLSYCSDIRMAPSAVPTPQSSFLCLLHSRASWVITSPEGCFWAFREPWMLSLWSMSCSPVLR